MNNIQAPSQTIARQIENMNLPETFNPANIQQNLSEGVATVSNNISSVKETVGNTLNEFSSKDVMNASTEFLESNSIIAKFAFLVLVIIIFRCNNLHIQPILLSDCHHAIMLFHTRERFGQVHQVV